MPYPQRNPGFLTAFMDSQRPPPGSHLSAFLHGESTFGDSRSGGEREEEIQPVRRATAPIHSNPRETLQGYYGPGVRPRASTMSIIDPVHSPNTRPRSPDRSTTLYQEPGNREASGGNNSRPPPSYEWPYQDTGEWKKASKHSHHRPDVDFKAWRKARPRPMLFPNIMDRRIRQKSIGTLLSGTLLTLVLTTCEYKYSTLR